MDGIEWLKETYGDDFDYALYDPNVVFIEDFANQIGCDGTPDYLVRDLISYFDVYVNNQHGEFSDPHVYFDTLYVVLKDDLDQGDAMRAIEIIGKLRPDECDLDDNLFLRLWWD